MTTVVSTEDHHEPPPNSTEPSTERKVGEHEAKLDQLAEDVSEAQAEAETARMIAEITGGPHIHDDYVTHDSLASSLESLATRLREELIPPAPPEPSAIEEPQRDTPPRSREKRVRKRSLAERFYGG